MTFALIPAAGKSTRMGRPKLALPIGDRTVLECVIATLQQAGVEHILVVVGPHVPELATIAELAGAKSLLLAAGTPDMRATVLEGLGWLEEHFRPTVEDAWLLVPADHPTLDTGVVRHLLRAHALDHDHSIIVPTYQGKRGHPTLFDWRHVPAIRELPAGLGMNVYLRLHATETLELAVEKPSILWDLDTPEDYERLLRLGRKDGKN